MPKDKNIKTIELMGEIRKINTLADFSVNVTFNISESYIEPVKAILEHVGDYVGIAVVLFLPDPDPEPGGAK